MTQIYDATMLNDYRRCPQYFNMRHQKGLVRQGGGAVGAAEAGGAIHAGLEAWFGGATIEVACSALCVEYESRAGSWGVSSEKYPLVFLEDVLIAYTEKWPRAKEKFIVIANEQWLQDDALRYGCVLDRLVKQGAVTMPMDTKTTAMYFGKNYFEKFQLSTQLRGQVVISQLHFEGVANGVLVDAIHLNTRNHKVKMEHFQRDAVLYSDEQLANFRSDVADQIKLIEAHAKPSTAAKLAGGDFEKWPQHDQRCFDWFKPCPYFLHCTSAWPEVAEEESYEKKEWAPWKRKGS